MTVDDISKVMALGVLGLLILGALLGIGAFVALGHGSITLGDSTESFYRGIYATCMTLLSPDPADCKALASSAWGFDLHAKEIPGWTWPLPKLRTGQATVTP